MVERAISYPLESDAASVLFGPFILACGLLLFSFLLRSIRVAAASSPHPTARPAERPAELAVARPVSRRAASPAKMPPAPRPFHRFYVDDARISR